MNAQDKLDEAYENFENALSKLLFDTDKEDLSIEKYHQVGDVAEKLLDLVYAKNERDETDAKAARDY